MNGKIYIDISIMLGHTGTEEFTERCCRRSYNYQLNMFYYISNVKPVFIIVLEKNICNDIIFLFFQSSKNKLF
jgi:hypothetical protein